MFKRGVVIFLGDLSFGLGRTGYVCFLGSCLGSDIFFAHGFVSNLVCYKSMIPVVFFSVLFS